MAPPERAVTTPHSNPPLVSVVVAAYGAGRYLEEAVRDAAAQSYPAVEVVVSDDGASPAARAIAEAAGPRVTYRANADRLGAAGNHWAAFRAARGEWVGILNHDDRWGPAFLSRVMAALADCPDAVVGFCDHRVIDAEGQDVPGRADELSSLYGRDRLRGGRQRSLPGLVLRQTIPLAMGAVFRKSAIDLDALPNGVGPAYDLWLCYLLARSGGAAVYVPERLTSWRAHPQNQTSLGDVAWQAGGAACWSAMASDPAFGGHRREVRRKAAAAGAAAAVAWLRAGNPAAARAVAAAAVRARPFGAKALAALALACLPAPVARPLLRRV